MYEQIASVLDSNRSYNDRSPSRHSTESFSPRGEGRTSSAAVWMTPASQESARRPDLARVGDDEEVFSEPTQPTRGERRAAPLHKHLLSDKSESIANRTVPPWLTGGRRAWLLCADRIRRGRYMQRSFALILLAAQVLVGTAVVLYYTTLFSNPTQISIVWWSILGSLALVLIQTIAWCIVSLPEFIDVALSGSRCNSCLFFVMIRSLAWELLNLLDTWIFLTGFNYLLIFQGHSNTQALHLTNRACLHLHAHTETTCVFAGAQSMTRPFLMSTAILSAGFSILGLKYRKGCEVWEHDPNSLYYDLDCMDLRQRSPGSI